MHMKKSFDFSAKYSALQKLTEKLESGDLSLEENVKLFEQGLKLAKELKNYLAQIETQIKVIKEKY